jgi:hypothetical protein
MTGLALPLHHRLPLHRCGEVAAFARGTKMKMMMKRKKRRPAVIGGYAFACEPR